jgi:hypothetical protein
VSANSDTRKVLDYAEKHGLEVVKAKHGGYAIVNSVGEVVARARTGGSQPRFWVKNAMRSIDKAAA